MQIRCKKCGGNVHIIQETADRYYTLYCLQCGGVTYKHLDGKDYEPSGTGDELKRVFAGIKYGRRGK